MAVLAAGSDGAFLATGLYEGGVPATSLPTADATRVATSPRRATPAQVAAGRPAAVGGAIFAARLRVWWDTHEATPIATHQSVAR